MPLQDPSNPLYEHLVRATDPLRRNQAIALGVNWSTIQKLVDAKWSYKVGEYLGLVHGRQPANPDPEARNRFPQPDYEGLLQPSAIFKGLRRPLHDGLVEIGDDVLTYVCTPSFTCRHVHHRDFGPVLMKEQPPNDSVFTAYVSLDPNHLDGIEVGVHTLLSRVGAPTVGGVVFFWEWTERSRSKPTLPEDFANRYGPRLL